MNDPERRPAIWVLAGTNGAGKSSIGGAALRAQGAAYYNPDEAAQRFRAAMPDMDIAEANSHAWKEGKRLLERAIAERKDFTFETTLGGQTMTRLLREAIAIGFDVHVWFVGLEGVELHLARVRARAAQGGHDIPEEAIRQRYDTSRENLVDLLPGLASLRLFDNSADGDPSTGGRPAPRLLLHIEQRRIRTMSELKDAPRWARPVLAAALLVER